MIASLFGTVRALQLSQLVIEVNAVGYQVQITSKTAARLSVGRDYQLFTSMIVREDSMTLYGFIENEERELFDLVQTVSGIGPKVALAITAAMSIDEFAYAINAKDDVAIAAVPGIGKKGAQRIILELSGKLDFSHPSAKSVGYSWRDQLIDALTGLGFSRKQAEQSINEISANRDAKKLSQMNPSDLLKLALAHANTQKGLGK
jgi:Holliday junction DNA helicase RuvA